MDKHNLWDCKSWSRVVGIWHIEEICCAQCHIFMHPNVTFREIGHMGYLVCCEVGNLCIKTVRV